MKLIITFIKYKYKLKIRTYVIDALIEKKNEGLRENTAEVPILIFRKSLLENNGVK